MAVYSELVELARNPQFQTRVHYALVKASVDVLAEEPVVDKRRAYAAKVLSGSCDLFAASLTVLSNPSIADSADLNTPNNGIPDGDIQFAVNSLFNALASV